MINPQLLNYVRAQRQAGVPKEEIIKALSGGGWSAADAQDAFAAIEGVQVPPVSPKPPAPPVITPAPTPTPQPRPVQPAPPQPMAQPVSQPLQATMRTQPQPVVQRQPVYAQVVKKRRIGPWIFMLFLFLIIGFIGGAYAAVAYPVVHDMVQELKNFISPPTLEPVTEEESKDTPLPSFMPTLPPLGTGSTSTSSTSTASTTAN